MTSMQRKILICLQELQRCCTWHSCRVLSQNRSAECRQGADIIITKQLLRVQRCRCRAVLSLCWLLTQATTKNDGLNITSKENSHVILSFWYNSTFFLLSWQLLQLEPARFQGRVRPDQREDLRLTWKLNRQCRIMTTVKFWPERKNIFFSEAAHSLSCWLVLRLSSIPKVTKERKLTQLIMNPNRKMADEFVMYKSSRGVEPGTTNTTNL